MGSKVIIFGPTGQIGSAAAVTASEHGAKVVLAMRDPSKAVPALSKQQEETGGFERVQADLSKPETVSAAVSKTGAKRAFFYLDFTSRDGMKGAIDALKSSGIEYVVFLSSWGVQKDCKEIKPDDLLPYLHASVEINLANTFGKGNYLALRPAHFASNTQLFTSMIRKGHVRMFGPDILIDYISPEDIGRVAGRLIVGGASAADGQEFIYLCGPGLTSQRDAMVMIGKALGIDVKVDAATREQAVDDEMAAGRPKALVENLHSKLQAVLDSGDLTSTYPANSHEEASKNLRKYGGGKEPTKLHEWIAANKQLFVA